MNQPFYDPLKSYQENYEQGPFGALTNRAEIRRIGWPQHTFLGLSVHRPFGIPAGPLLNSNFTTAAFQNGFDLCVYKTVRSRYYPAHPWPNVLAAHVEGESLKLTSDKADGVLGDAHFMSPLSITNSFGVPSMPPDLWQADMQKAVAAAGDGQVLIGSFQGTRDGSGDVQSYIEDFVLTAHLVKETGAPILEVNISCPNEGTSHLLCFDTERTVLIVQRIKDEIGDLPLILKLAYFTDEAQLENFVSKLGRLVQGFSAINTISAQIIDKDGAQALPGAGREHSGVCGSAIKWAGLEMVARLARIRDKFRMGYEIIGVGGVLMPADYLEYRAAGADAVMSATGAMWNAGLAKEIYEMGFSGQ